jgi:hypothetical protein
MTPRYDALTAEEPPSSGTAATLGFRVLDPVDTMITESAMAKGKSADLVVS